MATPTEREIIYAMRSGPASLGWLSSVAGGRCNKGVQRFYESFLPADWKDPRSRYCVAVTESAYLLTRVWQYPRQRRPLGSLYHLREGLGCPPRDLHQWGWESAPAWYFWRDVHHSYQVLDGIDESLVAEIGTEASHNLTAHSFVILPGMEPLDILHLGETVLTDLFHHSLVRISSLLLESLYCFQDLFLESFDARRQTELWAASIIAHRPEDIQYGRGS